MTLLRLERVGRRFGGIAAVDDVSLSVPQGGIHALVGPNGAGKTTLFNLVSGLIPPTSGRVLLDGKDITWLPPERRAALGIARTFQNLRLFGDMTALENVLTGLHPRMRTGLLAVLLRTRTMRREERLAVVRAREALALAGLSARADVPATALAYGEARRLEIARALAGGPRLILLDEPAAGLNPAERVALGAMVRSIAEAGTTVLLVEHDMPFVMGLSQTIAVLNFGRLIFHGAPAAARTDAGVIEAYLGPVVAARLAAQDAG